MVYLPKRVNNIADTKAERNCVNMKKEENQQGSVTLETSIVLPIFIFIFLFIYGLFSVISAQNQMTHTLIQASKSLSLDSYLTENVESLEEEGTVFWDGLADMVIDLVRSDNDPCFSSRSDWYKAEDGNPSIAKERFIGYLTGGDEVAADEKLKNMGIVGGLDGITFETKVDGENLIVTIKYEIQYWFDFFDVGKIPMEQSIRTHLWM